MDKNTDLIIRVLQVLFRKYKRLNRLHIYNIHNNVVLIDDSIVLMYPIHLSLDPFITKIINKEIKIKEAPHYVIKTLDMKYREYLFKQIQFYE